MMTTNPIPTLISRCRDLASLTPSSQKMTVLVQAADALATLTAQLHEMTRDRQDILDLYTGVQDVLSGRPARRASITAELVDELKQRADAAEAQLEQVKAIVLAHAIPGHTVVNGVIRGILRDLDAVVQPARDATGPPT